MFREQRINCKNNLEHHGQLGFMVLHCELCESNCCWLPQQREQAAATRKAEIQSVAHTQSILAGTQGKGPSEELFLHTQIRASQVAIFGISLF